MENILLDPMYDLPDLKGVEEVVINSEVVEGRANPLLIYAEQATGAGYDLLGEKSPITH